MASVTNLAFHLLKTNLLLLFLLVLSSTTLLCEAGYVLYPAGTIYPGNNLKYNNFQLTLQHDCNLVLTDNSNQIWSTKTQASICYLSLERTGELVLYDGERKRIWASGTSGRWGNYIFVIQNNRNLVVAKPPVWSTNTQVASPPLTATDGTDMGSVNVLIRGEYIFPGRSLKNGKWELKMQHDCNLVLYENGNKAIWSTGTAGKASVCYSQLQFDGNFVILDGSGNRIWETNTVRDQNFLLVLQNDGNLVLYGPVLWHADTWIRSSLTSTITGPLLPSVAAELN